jgi:hypothetical protein
VTTEQQWPKVMISFLPFAQLKHVTPKRKGKILKKLSKKNNNNKTINKKNRQTNKQTKRVPCV